MTSCVAYNYDTYFTSNSATYYLKEVKSISNYYILKSIETSTDQKVTIIVEKDSPQLKNLQLIVGFPYELTTYSFYDLYNLGGVLCHEIENNKVWCSDEESDLRFTESMGNEVSPKEHRKNERRIKKSRTKEKYTIKNIDKTKRFYIVTVTNINNKEILIVIDKQSKQIKNKKVEIGIQLKLNTYSIFDVMHINTHLSHYVDNQRIWVYEDNIDLRFTDSMGDDIEFEINTEQE